MVIEVMNAISWQIASIVLCVCAGLALWRVSSIIAKSGHEARALRHDETMAQLRVNEMKSIESRVASRDRV